MTWLLPILAATIGPACLSVQGDRILARDLAAAAPAFSSLAPEQVIGFAPEPGTRRLLTQRELGRLAADHGLALEGPAELCVERAAAPLSEEQILSALRATLAKEAPGRDIRLELIDFSKYPAPAGELEFSKAALAAPPLGRPGTPVLWRGRIRYSASKTFPIWARLRMTVAGTRVVASETLPAGKPVQAGSLRLETGELFPFGQQTVTTLDQVVGRRPLHSLRAGSAILPSALATPKAIEKGDAVTVEVTSGAAQLSLQARAETAANPGDVISVRNMENGKVFQGRLSPERKVTVDANAQVFLPGGAVPRGAAGGSR